MALAAATAAGNILAYVFTIAMSRLLGVRDFGELGTLLGVWLIAQIPPLACQLAVARALAGGPDPIAAGGGAVGGGAAGAGAAAGGPAGGGLAGGGAGGSGAAGSGAVGNGQARGDAAGGGAAGGGPAAAGLLR